MWDQVRKDAEATSRHHLGYGSGQIPAGMSRTYQALAS